MEFWGVEVKNGESLKVSPGDGMVVHISQAALGENREGVGTAPVYLYLTVDSQKFVLGTLCHQRIPQATVEVVLERGFELSHSWKDGSVYFAGYKVHTHDDVPATDEDTEDELPLITDNGKPEPKKKEGENKQTKPDAVVKKQVSFKEPDEVAKAKANQNDDESDEDEDEDEDEDGDGDEDENMSSAEDEDQKVTNQDEMDAISDAEDDEDDSDENSDEETPNKPEASIKRPAESSLRTPTADKKAKLAIPEKSDGKKGSVHIATPHPAAKQAGKRPASSELPKPQTAPKPSGSYPCKSCNRSFTTEMGLQSHTKAKHSAAQ